MHRPPKESNNQYILSFPTPEYRLKTFVVSGVVKLNSLLELRSTVNKKSAFIGDLQVGVFFWPRSKQKTNKKRDKERKKKEFASE